MMLSIFSSDDGHWYDLFRKKMSISIFCPFFNHFFFFFTLSCKSCSYILDTTLYWLYHLQIFSPIQWLSFYFVDDFLCCVKVFKFNQVLFIFVSTLFALGELIQNIATIYVKGCCTYAFFLKFCFWYYI